MTPTRRRHDRTYLGLRFVFPLWSVVRRWTICYPRMTRFLSSSHRVHSLVSSHPPSFPLSPIFRVDLKYSDLPFRDRDPSAISDYPGSCSDPVPHPLQNIRPPLLNPPTKSHPSHPTLVSNAHPSLPPGPSHMRVPSHVLTDRKIVITSKTTISIPPNHQYPTASATAHSLRPIPIHLCLSQATQIRYLHPRAPIPSYPSNTPVPSR